MIPVGILDVLADTEEWLNWTRHFGPISGHDSKLANPAKRYLVTISPSGSWVMRSVQAFYSNISLMWSCGG
jgi:hypothetical protein